LEAHYPCNAMSVLRYVCQTLPCCNIAHRCSLRSCCRYQETLTGMDRNQQFRALEQQLLIGLLVNFRRATNASGFGVDSALAYLQRTNLQLPKFSIRQGCQDAETSVKHDFLETRIRCFREPHVCERRHDRVEHSNEVHTRLE
jgi:hypothetical protein